jgi:hypothetical protein
MTPPDPVRHDEYGYGAGENRLALDTEEEDEGDDPAAEITGLRFRRRVS